MKKLIKKGWSEEEIKKAQAILNTEKEHDAHFSKIVFWSAIIVVVCANFFVSLVLVPFLIVLKGWVLYSIVALLALMIGFLYNFLIMDIGHLAKKHHILAGIIIPIIALGNMVVMTFFSNQFIKDVHANNEPHNIWTVSIVFAVAFILPYVMDKVVKMFKK